MGRPTPTIAPTCRAHIPAALIAHSVRSRPWSVSTAVIAPRDERSNPVTRTLVSMATPRYRARRASASVAPLGAPRHADGL